jgi:NADP-dependent 3-hydroxy acid dehydrogenase YdfG
MNGVTSEILKKEDRILVVKLDITDETSIRQAIKVTLDKWETIHVLLNV